MVRLIEPAPVAPPPPSTARPSPAPAPAPSVAVPVAAVAPPTPVVAAPVVTAPLVTAPVVAAPAPAVTRPTASLSVTPRIPTPGAAAAPADSSAGSRSGPLAYGGLDEVRPSQQVLSASLRGSEPGSVSASSAIDRPARMDGWTPAAACVPVVLTAAANRPRTTWVDLTGDGLIVSAVDTARVAAVLARAGGRAEAGAHCLPQASVKELLGSAQRPASSGPMKLVKLAQGWQLMAPPPAAAALSAPRALGAPKKQARHSGRVLARG